MPNELKLAFLYINLYFGESGRNAYSRGKEHFEKKIAKDGDNSVLWLHSIHHHQVLEDVNYNMKIKGDLSKYKYIKFRNAAFYCSKKRDNIQHACIINIFRANVWIRFNLFESQSWRQLRGRVSKQKGIGYRLLSTTTCLATIW